MKTPKGWKRLKVGDQLMPGDRYYIGNDQWANTVKPYSTISAFTMSLAGAYIRKKSS